MHDSVYAVHPRAEMVEKASLTVGKKSHEGLETPKYKRCNPKNPKRSESYPCWDTSKNFGPYHGPQTLSRGENPIGEAILASYILNTIQHSMFQKRDII